MAYTRDSSGSDSKEILVAIEALIAQYEGTGLTFTTVKVITEANVALALKAALASNYTRLHMLVGTMAAAGNMTLEDSSGTDIIGPVATAALDNGIPMAFQANPDGCPITAVGKGLSLLTTQVFNGFAIVSQATA
ncbi:MAG: hypothetical protein IMZ62_04990 [Chloroflexi bacterium]|nr:hypothetical protein [Chloroflexota bacterium]